MALQGNLRDFSVTEILQLLGTQKKTGCLTIEASGTVAVFYVQEGRIVSTRPPGLTKDDPLLRFLLKTHRLSYEQYRGILTIQRESNRDLEDLLVNGRYLDGEQLGFFIERQILDDLMRAMTWDDGTYRFDPHSRWPNPPLVRLSVEGVLIEIARRMDEKKRFELLFGDPHQLIGVHDLPDADEHLSEEECELFGIIDGRHTVAQIAEEAPLSEYETYEALQRMMESGWIEIVGRSDPAVAEGGAAAAEGARVRQEARDVPRSPALVRDLAVGLVVLAATLGLRVGAGYLTPDPGGSPSRDPFAVAELRDVRFALELYRGQNGRYPERLEELAAEGWVARHRLEIMGHPLRYQPGPDRGHYALELQAAP